MAAATRAMIRSGALRGRALLERLMAVPFSERDTWVNEALGLEEGLPDDGALPPGAVPYLPCGVEEILAMVREAPLRADDHFVDVGSGLGRVAILAHLLTGARASGIEIQEPLVRSARARCEELGLDGVTFLHANAADVALDGSVFFLYAPFNGELLARALRRIEDVARRRPIVVCTVGLELTDARWLRPRVTTPVSMSLYDSCSPGERGDPRGSP